MPQYDELLLIEKAQNGDKRSVERILNQYEPLCHKMAKKFAFTARNHDHDDLVQEGRLGLMNGIKSYDSTKGAKPFTWFYYCVRGQIHGAGRVDRKQPEYPYSIEDCERAYNVEDATQMLELKEDLPTDLMKNLIEQCCGGLNTKRASIVIDRYGLFGRPELRNCECAQKYNLTKYAVTSHTCQFKKKARKNFPEYANFI